MKIKDYIKKCLVTETRDIDPVLKRLLGRWFWGQRCLNGGD